VLGSKLVQLSRSQLPLRTGLSRRKRSLVPNRVQVGDLLR
jgi:hypothetical protein